MILKRIFIFMLLQLFLMASNMSLAQSELGFALHLYRSGENQSAVTELERWIYFNRDDPFVPYAQYLVALSLSRMEKHDRAAAKLERLIDQYGEVASYAGLICESHLQLLNIRYRNRQFSDFQIEADRFAAACTDPDARLAAAVQNMTVAVHVYNRRWDEALHALQGAGYVDSETRELLESGIDEIFQHNPKSPVLGGMLAVIPGLGHLYAGRGLAGVRSFLINGAFIGLTVFCFVTGMPVLGALFCIVEAALYLSNIYGGVNAVMQQNARFIIERRDELLKMLSIPPLDVITLREELFSPYDRP